MNRTAQQRVATVVAFIAHHGEPISADPAMHIEDAVAEAVAAGYLRRSGDGAVHLAEPWQRLRFEKDPEGVVLNHMAASEYVARMAAEGLPTSIDLGLLPDRH